MHGYLEVSPTVSSVALSQDRVRRIPTLDAELFRVGDPLAYLTPPMALILVHGS